MYGNIEGVSADVSTHQPLRGLDADSVLIAAQFLENAPDLVRTSDRIWELALHRRRMFVEALYARPAENGAMPKTATEMMNEADDEVRAAIAANDGSLEQIIEASRRREQAKLERSTVASNGILNRWRARKAGKIALRSPLTPQPFHQPTSAESA